MSSWPVDYDNEEEPESLLRYYVQRTGRVEEPTVRGLLQKSTAEAPIVQPFIDRYSERQ